jgi:hypothetical protein
MRNSLLALVAFAICSPIVAWAQAPVLRGGHHHSAHSGHRAPAVACPCGCVAIAPVAVPVCDTCGPGINAGGPCGPYSGLCSNYAEFYRVLYAEFYARNPWYLEQKAKELAERRARLHLTNTNTP